MPGPRILLVKLSSLGDVIHLLPAVTDLRARVPEARVSWAIEPPYAPLLGLHPGVDETLPVPLRAVRSRPLSPDAWRGLRSAKRALRASRFDLTIDAQGLVKSAVVARWSHAPTFGPDARSARERFAARLYDVRLVVPWTLHAVERNRRLLAEVFGYAIDQHAHYGLVAPAAAPAWVPSRRYAVLLHAASRPAKKWPDASWIELARRLVAEGYSTVLPGGNVAEREASARLAAAAGPEAMAAPATSIAEAAALLAHAALVVGVDTGLTHLAVALGVPTVGIYRATSPERTGLHGGPHARNVGGAGASPSVEEVAAAAGIAPSP
jgi:heptosyltransferase-1